MLRGEGEEILIQALGLGRRTMAGEEVRCWAKIPVRR